MSHKVQKTDCTEFSCQSRQMGMISCDSAHQCTTSKSGACAAGFRRYYPPRHPKESRQAKQKGKQKGKQRGRRRRCGFFWVPTHSSASNPQKDSRSSPRIHTNQPSKRQFTHTNTHTRTHTHTHARHKVSNPCFLPGAVLCCAWGKGTR